MCIRDSGGGLPRSPLFRRRGLHLPAAARGVAGVLARAGCGPFVRALLPGTCAPTLLFAVVCVCVFARASVRVSVCVRARVR
eukprot:13051806-Alexandrium_andersonii.AAC.1